MYDIHLLNSYLQVKKAYALANSDLGRLEAPVQRAILQASDEILSQKYEIKFSSEPLPSVSGISINNAINEAIASRAGDILDGKSGQYQLANLIDDVELNQEIAPLFCLAARLAILLALAELEIHLLNLERLVRRESLTLARVLKVNFPLADPSTTGEWGRRLNVFATAGEAVLERLQDSANALIDKKKWADENQATSVSGGKSVASADTEELMLEHLARLTNFRLKGQDAVWQNNLWQNTFLISDLLLIGTALKDLALLLSKLASVAKIVNADKGKSSANMLADGIKMASYQAVSQNLSLTFLAQNEQMEGDLLMPLLTENLLNTISILQAAVLTFTEQGILSSSPA